MAVSDRNCDPTGNPFAYELSYSKQSCTSDEQNQLTSCELPHQSCFKTEYCQSNIRPYGSWVSFEENINTNTTANAQQQSRHGEQGKFGMPVEVGQNQGLHGRSHRGAEMSRLWANHRFEDDAQEKVTVPSVPDPNAPINPEIKQDDIQSHSDPPHPAKPHQDRAKPARGGNPAEPDPYYLLSFQEWYKRYGSAVQQEEQPTQSWLVASQTQQKPPKVPNYLILSIVACFFCFLIGAIAVSYVLTSSKQRKAGKYQAAIESASTAQKLCILAIVLGVIAFGVSGFLYWYQIQRINKTVSQNR